jgi:hypothetical protein
MTNLPEDPLRESPLAPGNEAATTGPAPAFHIAEQPNGADAPFAEAASALTASASVAPEQPLFSAYAQPPARRPVRIPHFGHLLLLSLLIAIAVGILALTVALAAYFHPFGWKFSVDAAATDIRFNLLSEALLYFVTFGLSLVVFPMIWNEGYFAGLQWRGRVAGSKFGPLAGIASACFGLAILDQVLLPGPANAPIDQMISSPGAAWLMFAFGVTVAPFFEEMLFRGFLLPALSTACDWIAETIKAAPPRPLDENGHPQWSLAAMIVGSVLTSIPFALLHVAQQGHSLGPFLLLIVISLILCAVRLKTKSLAASTLVHASYNFLIFSIELIATGGFRHFDKM